MMQALGKVVSFSFQAMGIFKPLTKKILYSFLIMNRQACICRKLNDYGWVQYRTEMEEQWIKGQGCSVPDQLFVACVTEGKLSHLSAPPSAALWKGRRGQTHIKESSVPNVQDFAPWAALSHVTLSSYPRRPRNTHTQAGTPWPVSQVRTAASCHLGKCLHTLTSLLFLQTFGGLLCTQTHRAAEDKQSDVQTLKLWGNSWWYHNTRQKTRGARPNHTANSRRDVHPTAGGA